jgi:flagellar basal-body rod protein FlgB
MKGINDLLFDRQFRGLEKTLDLTWRRNEAITSNITNAETPQYRAVDVNFAEELDRAFSSKGGTLMKTSGKHLDVSSSELAHLTPDYSGATKPDGNNVDIDLQMGRLAYNSGRYSLTTQVLRKRFQLLVNAIRQTT